MEIPLIRSQRHKELVIIRTRVGHSRSTHAVAPYNKRGVSNM